MANSYFNGEISYFRVFTLGTLISKNQKEYYSALSKSDKTRNSTPFIDYLLRVIDLSINQLVDKNKRTFTSKDRLEHFISIDKKTFTRKEYMTVFKDISSATASRDLRKGVDLQLFEKTGEKSKTTYKLS
jgi:Fic family protein